MYAVNRLVKIRFLVFGSYQGGGEAVFWLLFTCCCLYVRGDVFKELEVYVGGACEDLSWYLLEDPRQGVGYVAGVLKVPGRDLRS